MERLTIRTDKGAALKMAAEYHSKQEAHADLMKKYRIAIDRLADYEDIVDLYAGERRKLFPDEADKIKEQVVRAAFGLKDIENVMEKSGRKALANQARRAMDVLMNLLPPQMAYGLNEQMSFDMPGLLMECEAKTLHEAFDKMDEEHKLNAVWQIAHFVTLNGISKDCLHAMLRWLAENTLTATGGPAPKEEPRHHLKVLIGGLEESKE